MLRVGLRSLKRKIRTERSDTNEVRLREIGADYRDGCVVANFLRHPAATFLVVSSAFWEFSKSRP